MPDASLSELTAEVAALRSEVRRLSDRETIRDLIARYGPTVDRGDSTGAANLWTETGVYDLGPDWPALNGRKAIAGVMEAETHQKLIHDGAAHFLSSPAITLAGDQAEAICHSAVMHWTGTAFELARVSANHFALEHAADQGWFIRKRSTRLLTGEEAARAVLTPEWS